MNTLSRYLLWAAIAATACMPLACEESKAQSGKVDAELSLPFYESADLTPQWLSALEAESQQRHRIPSFRFSNQDGDQVDSSALEGKITVANFFYATCGGICPAMTAQLNKVADSFMNDDRVVILSHSVSPEVDTTAVLKAYAEKHGTRSKNWHFLRGDRQATYDLARSAYFADDGLRYDKTAEDFLHTENVYLVDAQRRIRGVYSGTRPIDVRQLIGDIHELKKEMKP